MYNRSLQQFLNIPLIKASLFFHRQSRLKAITLDNQALNFQISDRSLLIAHFNGNLVGYKEFGEFLLTNIFCNAQSAKIDTQLQGKCVL